MEEDLEEKGGSEGKDSDGSGGKHHLVYIERVKAQQVGVVLLLFLLPWTVRGLPWLNVTSDGSHCLACSYARLPVLAREIDAHLCKLENASDINHPKLMHAY